MGIQRVGRPSDGSEVEDDTLFGAFGRQKLIHVADLIAELGVQIGTPVIAFFRDCGIEAEGSPINLEGHVRAPGQRAGKPAFGDETPGADRIRK